MSVCGTVASQPRARSFSWHLGSPTLAAIAFVPRFGFIRWICLPVGLYVFNRISITGLSCPDASLHTQTVVSGSGILTRLPSTTPFGLALGTDLPCADELNAGNLRFSARLIPTVVIATYADKVFSTRSRLSPPLRVRPFGTSSLPVECSPTIKKFRRTPRS